MTCGGFELIAWKSQIIGLVLHSTISIRLLRLWLSGKAFTVKDQAKYFRSITSYDRTNWNSSLKALRGLVQIVSNQIPLESRHWHRFRSILSSIKPKLRTSEKKTENFVHILYFYCWSREGSWEKTISFFDKKKKSQWLSTRKEKKLILPSKVIISFFQVDNLLRHSAVVSIL